MLHFLLLVFAYNPLINKRDGEGGGGMKKIKKVRIRGNYLYIVKHFPPFLTPFVIRGV
jgi:hypothetical protein